MSDSKDKFFERIIKAINDGNPNNIKNDDKLYLGVIQELKNQAFPFQKSLNMKDEDRISQSNMRNRNNKVLFYALQNEYLDSNRFLLAVISSIEKTSNRNIQDFYLLLLSFAFRTGANPNLYVIEPMYGKIHLLIHTLVILKKQQISTFFSEPISQDFVKQILLLMILFGSNVSRKAILADYKDITKEDETKFNRKFVKASTEREKEDWITWTVADVIYGQVNFPVTIDTINESLQDARRLLERQIDPSGVDKYDFVKKFGLLLDDPHFAIHILGNVAYQPSLPTALEYNAFTVISFMDIPDIHSKSESASLLICIDSLGTEAFVNLLMRGRHKISYFTMNRLLINYRNCTMKNDKYNRVYSESYLSMIKSALALGASFDNFQLNFIETFTPKEGQNNASVAAELKKIYEEKLWKKSCRGSEASPIPKKLKILAISLGLMDDPSLAYIDSKDLTIKPVETTKKNICLAFYNMSNEYTTRDDYTTKAQNLLRKQIQASTTTMKDITLNSIQSDTNCINASENLQPLDYTNYTLTYYRDDDTKKLYCFTPNMYEDILYTSKNPYTEEKLPNRIVEKIDYSISIWKREGIEPENILSTKDAYKKAFENDIISNEKTDYIKRTIELIFSTRGIPGDKLKNQKTETYNGILAVVDRNEKILQELDQDKSLQYATFCRAFYAGIKERGFEKIPVIMNTIIGKIKAKTF